MPERVTEKSLEDLFHRPGYELGVQVKKAESREELRSRLRQQEADAGRQRHKDKVILWAVVITVSVVSSVCLILTLVPRIQPETSKWATTLLTTVVAGYLGPMTGRGSKS